MYRQGYSKLFAFSQVHKSGRPTPDVIRAGFMSYPNAMRVTAVECCIEFLKAKGIKTSALNVTAVLGATDAVKEAVKSALGTAVLSRISVREELERGQLMEISIRGIRMPRTFHMISHKKRVLPQPYSAFLQFAISSK